MQNSIVKIVAAIGVIAIGTMVVLEVRNRLPQMQTAGSTAPVSTATAEGDATTGMSPEQSMMAQLGTSEFDEILNGGAASGTTDFTPPYSLDEPPLSGSTVDSNSFVDTNVRRDAIAGDNPFSADPVAEIGPGSNGTVGLQIHQAAYVENNGTSHAQTANLNQLANENPTLNSIVEDTPPAPDAELSIFIDEAPVATLPATAGDSEAPSTVNAFTADQDPSQSAAAANTTIEIPDFDFSALEATTSDLPKSTALNAAAPAARPAEQPSSRAASPSTFATDPAGRTSFSGEPAVVAPAAS
ncbi:MAG: hypothetical protein KDA85_11355, partial [Planctomycetaceae bacterium]|nr:hypothetical protein [Planctomycetaceae bacterium]